MRVLGAVLLVSGFLLCLSIAWAAPGFVMMGVALICLLVAEDRNKRLQLATPASLEPTNENEANRKRSGKKDFGGSQDPRARALRAVYEAVADHRALMAAAPQTDPDSKPLA
jgi:hypothetical protein